MNMNGSNCRDDDSQREVPPIDPSIALQSQRFFTSIRADAYRCVRPVEKDMLAVPWGPAIDVIFDPCGAGGIVGGTVRLMARTAGTEVEIASASIVNANEPITLTGSCGCDEYVVKAQLGSDPGQMMKRVESYFFTRVYSGL